MEWRFQAGGSSTWQGDAIVAFLFEGETLDEACPELCEAAPWLRVAPGMMDVCGAKGEVSVLYGHEELSLPRVILVGLGKSAGLTDVTSYSALRRAAAEALCRARDLRLTNALFVVSPLARFGMDVERVVREVVVGAQLGLYAFSVCKSALSTAHDNLCGAGKIAWLGLAFCDAETPASLVAAANEGAHIAATVALARDLVNTPANALSPMQVAEHAQRIAAQGGQRCEVLDRDALTARGFGAHLAVGQGSCNPPCLVVLEHAPLGHETEKPLVVVGKGITFDSGGISIKPSAGMHEMKGDMAGAAAVLGLFAALGALQRSRRVIGLLACAENMPSACATRPGDVVTTLSGKTVEIVNTDAEGRLVLCDAMTYAQQQWTPDVLIDIATLTGACVVALGNDVAGLFSPDPNVCERVRGLGALVGEAFWPLPTHDRYFEALRSDVADFTNCGPREGGAVNAALFLKQFVDEGVRWAHLDIAGPGYASKKTPCWPAGGTGFGVRTLIDLADSALPTG